MPEASDEIRVEAFAMHARGDGTAELLRAVRQEPMLLVPDPTRELRSFRVAISMPLGTKRGRGRGSFIDSVIDAINAFYSEVVQNLKAWRATPPKMRELPTAEIEDTRLASTALSSQDGTEESPADVSDPVPAPAGVPGPVEPNVP